MRKSLLRLLVLVIASCTFAVPASAAAPTFAAEGIVTSIEDRGVPYGHRVELELDDGWIQPYRCPPRGALDLICDVLEPGDRVSVAGIKPNQPVPVITGADPIGGSGEVRATGRVLGVDLVVGVGVVLSLDIDGDVVPLLCGVGDELADRACLALLPGVVVAVEASHRLVLIDGSPANTRYLERLIVSRRPAGPSPSVPDRLVQ